MSQILLQPANAMITLENVNKWYGQFHVLKNINLTVQPGERIVLCGPSGSGKSTTIRCINHLEEHQQGRIVVDGIELNEDIRNIERVRQEVGMVFQHFNLFPHLTVLQNCTLAPIWVRKMPKKEAEALAMHYLERVRIAEHAQKFPGQISGGQQQRVAIARSLSKLDLILVEGFKHEEIAKIVLFRDGAGHRPEELVIDRHVIAVASDVPLNLDVALLDINDVEGLADFVVEWMQKQDG